MTPAPASLVASDLLKTYFGAPVVSGACLSLHPGEVTALVGRSGAGKTTLLRLLAGMERPDSGIIKSGDQILSDGTVFQPTEHRRIGLIFQDFALFPHMNVIKNITFGLGHLPKEKQTIVALEWLEKLGLQLRGPAYPHQLSGGEQQRVAIARALAPSPVAILMDEPFSGLDPVLREQARSAALSTIRASGTPALMVTHDADEAMAHADQVAVMSQGRILQTGTPEYVYTHPNSLTVAQALGQIYSINKEQLPTAWQSTLPDAKILYIRPEAIQIDPSSNVSLKVEHVRRHGAVTIITLLSGDSQLDAAVITQNPPLPGETIPVQINPASVFTFLENNS